MSHGGSKAPLSSHLNKDVGLGVLSVNRASKRRVHTFPLLCSTLDGARVGFPREHGAQDGGLIELL